MTEEKARKNLRGSPYKIQPPGQKGARYFCTHPLSLTLNLLKEIFNFQAASLKLSFSCYRQTDRQTVYW